MRLPGTLLSLAWILCAASACGGGPPATRRVILITCDTLRADHLGLYGYGRPTSPCLDAFGAESSVFERAFTTSPLTGPAISSLLTGQLPDELGVSGGNRMLMPSQAVTLAEVLSGSGVATAAVVSNWVLRRPPKELGDVGVQQGFAHFDDEMRTREPNRPALERAAEATTDAALAWLSGRAGPDRDRFFLWVHYQDPHGPYTPPESIADVFRRDHPDDPELPLGTTQKGKGQIPAYQHVVGDRRPGSYVDRYDGEIRAFDTALGRLFAGLRERDLYEGSWIVLTADHGESLGERGYWFCHGENVQREAVHVPLLVRFPSGSRAGRRREVVSHLDLWPTVLEVFGLEPRPNRGASLLAPALPADRIAGHTLGRVGAPGRVVGICGDELHVVLEAGSPPRVFELRAHTEEESDPPSSDPERAGSLVARWDALVARDAIQALQGVEMLVSPEARRAMQGLGYVDGDDLR